MFGGGGGLNPRKMEQMMDKMGIDVEEIDAEEVIIRTAETELVFDSPDVTKMDARGQETYQVVGSPREREATDNEPEEAAAGAIPEADVEIVTQRTGANAATAREALERHDGDLAAAVDELE